MFRYVHTQGSLFFTGDWHIGTNDSPAGISPKFTEQNGKADAEIAVFARKNDTNFKIFQFTLDIRNGRYKDERARAIFSLAPIEGSFDYDEEKHQLHLYRANMTIFPLHYITQLTSQVCQVNATLDFIKEKSADYSLIIRMHI